MQGVEEPGRSHSYRRPQWPNIIGVIAMIFGCLGILIGILDWKLATRYDRVLEQMPKEIIEEVDRWRPVGTFHSLVGTMVSGALSVGAVGLLIRRFWGPMLCIGFAVVKIPNVLCAETTGYALRAAMRPLASSAGDKAMELFDLQISGSLQILATLFDVAVQCALPIFLLVWFSRPSIRDEIEKWR